MPYSTQLESTGIPKKVRVMKARVWELGTATKQLQAKFKAA